jgi:nucleotide-binding universal stress UspA family protein
MAFQHVLVATDFNECSNAAVELAVDIASRYGAALTVMHAYELHASYYPTYPAVGQVLEALQEAAEVELAKVVESVRARLPAARGVVRCGSAWEQILVVQRAQGADLIVVGSHGRKGLPRALLGSVAEKVVRLSEVPVLTVHGRSHGQPT